MPRIAFTFDRVARALIVAAAVASSIALAGCDIEGGISPTAKAVRPLSESMLADIERKEMTKDSPILVRIFKEESELEVWKEDKSGRLALLKTYPICRWSGELGPKFREGDRQAPEGFYTITPGQMNPKSSYYLAFNIGYPNSYDRSWNHTGSELMIHGDCSSRGCYAMTDEQIGEIYALARESFFGGQKAFQVQAFPFRMTAMNMAKHRNSPHMAFWRMLKEGYDHFEVTRLEPKVDVCERKYVFDAAPADSTKPLKFAPAAKCPTYEVPAEIAAAVGEKQQNDERQFAELSNSNIPTAPVVTGRDGGMNPVFAAVATPVDMGGGDVAVRAMAPVAPGTVPATVMPPGTTQVAAAPAIKPGPQLASAAPVQPVRASTGNMFSGLFSSKGDASSKDDGTQGKKSGGILDSMTRLVGLRGSDSDATPPSAVPPPKAKPAVQTASVTPSRPKPELAAAAAQRPSATVPGTSSAPATVGAIPPRAKPQPLPDNSQTASASQSTGLINGSQPVLPGSSFESRFGGFR